MSVDKLDKLERQRREADARYNDALSAFDAALVRPVPPLENGPAADGAAPAARSGWRQWPLGAGQRWLAPWIERQHAFNAGTAHALAALITRDRERAAAFERFQAALITYVQQITAFVETKDRQIEATLAQRLDEDRATLERQQPLLDIVPELRTQIAVVQRATGVLKGRLGSVPAGAAPAAAPPAVASQPAPAAGGDSTDDYKYVGFED